jgi:hypothetical protein
MESLAAMAGLSFESLMPHLNENGHGMALASLDGQEHMLGLLGVSIMLSKLPKDTRLFSACECLSCFWAVLSTWRFQTLSPCRAVGKRIASSKSLVFQV